MASSVPAGRATPSAPSHISMSAGSHQSGSCWAWYVKESSIAPGGSSTDAVAEAPTG